MTCACAASLFLSSQQESSSSWLASTGDMATDRTMKAKVLLLPRLQYPLITDIPFFYSRIPIKGYWSLWVRLRLLIRNPRMQNPKPARLEPQNLLGIGGSRAPSGPPVEVGTNCRRDCSLGAWGMGLYEGFGLEEGGFLG